MYKKIVFFSLLVAASFISIKTNAQWCTPTVGITGSTGDYINNVTIGSISNLNSGDNPSDYALYSQTGVFIEGFNYTFSLQTGSASWSQGIGFWIDYNGDNDFSDPGELVYTSPATVTSATVLTGNFSVPFGITPGITRLRVGCWFVNLITQANACSVAGFGEFEDYEITLVPGTPCSGAPTGGTAIASTTTICPGLTSQISSTGITYAANMIYQWQMSTNGGATWSDITVNGNNPNYSTPSLSSTTSYRIYVVCNNSGLSDTSSMVTVNVTGPAYAPLPYVQDFETWTSFCDNTDVPVDGSIIHFSNFPSSGANTWRREDQGATANWINAPFGMYTPIASSGNHSARFHTYYTSGSGSLDMYLDCSATVGNKTLLFDYKNDNLNFFGYDFLEVLMSTNGGTTFTTLGLFNSSPSWTTYPISIVSNSPNTIVRFKAYGDFQFSNDIGLDNIQVLEPCAGNPNAGAITPYTPCPNVPFNVTLTGNTLATGLSYQWESAPTSTGPWTVLGVTTVPTFNTQIAVPTFYRCTVTCTASGLSNTTAPYQYNLASFYICYCQSMSTTPFSQNIGNVKMAIGNSMLINNGTANPLLNNATSVNFYTNFTNLPAVTMYRDSTYNDTITTISYLNYYNSGYMKVYIDYNQDGIYDPNTENVCGGLCQAPGQTMISSFTVPNNASFGYTGMRIVYDANGTSSTVNPCGIYSEGETEDYVVNIVPPPCVKPPYAGIASISDTVICPGYSIFLQDTTHHSLFGGLSFNWQVSTNGVNFNDILGATLDTLTYLVNNNLWFRFKTVCNNNGLDSSFSNIVHVSLLPPIQCYPQSIAIGGSNDSTDNGAMNIMDKATNNNIYSFITGGPHLGNPLAVKGRTDYTTAGAMLLYADSTYGISVYDIMRTYNHADARVTVFIDYNNNQLYDIPSERVFSGVSGISTYYLQGEFHTPVLPALNVETGMRVIINNDLGFSAASDNGVGTYTSGETEDYVVKFKLKNNATIVNENVFDINEVSLFPNPTNGLINLSFNAKNTTNVEIKVLTMTGSEIMVKKLDHIFGKTSTSLDLSSLAKGTYMVKLISDNGKFVRKVTVD